MAPRTGRGHSEIFLLFQTENGLRPFPPLREEGGEDKEEGD